MSKKVHVLLAETPFQGDVTALCDWGWERASDGGKAGWKTPEGDFVGPVWSQAQLRGVDNLVIHCGYGYAGSPEWGLAQNLVARGRAEFGRVIAAEDISRRYSRSEPPQ